MAAAAPASTSIGTRTGPSARSITERGWEAEFAIPLKTLRYNPGEERTWGVNAMRNIRRKNEQVFLSPVPRGYNLYRVSVAGKLQGLSLPARRDMQVAALCRRRRSPTTRRCATDTVDRIGRRRPRLQVGRARRSHARSHGQHRLRAGRGRRAAGQPDALSAVLCREAPVLPRERAAVSTRAAAGDRPVLLAPHRPVCRPASRSTSSAGGRLSGKLGGYNVGLLNMQTEAAVDRRTGQTLAPANNFTRAAAAARRSADRISARCSSARQGDGARAAADDYNRAYGFDLGWQATTNGRLFAFLARTDSPDGERRIRLCRARRSTPTSTRRGRRAAATRRSASAFNPEVGFLRRRGLPAGRGPLQPELSAEAVAVDSPHPAARELQRVHEPAERAREFVRALALLRHPDAHGRALRLSVRDAAGSPAAAVHRLSGRHGTPRRDSRRASTRGRAACSKGTRT